VFTEASWLEALGRVSNVDYSSVDDGELGVVGIKYI